MSGTPTIGIVAGELSGDTLGAGLIKAIKQIYPEARFVGIGGPKMKALGCESLFDMDELAVMGLVEVLGRLPRLLSIRKQLKQYFLELQPDVFIGVDSPDFNLPLSRYLRQHGIHTAHYVSPSIWAWRPKRIIKIAKSIELMLTLFPFENQFYQQHGVKAVFVGHPLTRQLREQNSKAPPGLQLDPEKKTIALMPGSRMSEVSRLAPLMVEAARQLAEQNEYQFLLPVAKPKVKAFIESVVAQQGSGLNIHMLDGEAHWAMQQADVILIASGTATLEAMLLNKPMVITYKAAPLTFKIIWSMLQVPWVGLPNILANREIVPELLQDQATSTALAAAVTHWIDNPQQVKSVQQEFTTISTQLNQPSDELAAQALLQLAGYQP